MKRAIIINFGAEHKEYLFGFYLTFRKQKYKQTAPSSRIINKKL
jgi:hypothetical protein